MVRHELLFSDAALDTTDHQSQPNEVLADPAEDVKWSLVLDLDSNEQATDRQQ
jgi:hypothetical protein